MALDFLWEPRSLLACQSRPKGWSALARSLKSGCDTIPCMSWELIKSIQKFGADLRLILPFGLDLRLGDVISVSRRDGSFRLEGTCASLLGRGAEKRRSEQPSSFSLIRQSGDDVKMTFRAEGSASSLFEDLPTAKAGYDISFSSANAWLLAFTGRTLTVLGETNAFRRPILDAYRRQVWKPDWALVTGIGKVERLTLIASRSRDTKVAIAFRGQVDASAPVEVQLAAGATILTQNKELIQCMPDGPAVAFCQGMRVRDPWWKFWGHPDIRDLEKPAEPQDEAAASDEEFWEDMDKDMDQPD